MSVNIETRILMRVRIRGPGGQATISLSETATVGDLYSQIVEHTSVASFDVKYGYPPKPLVLDAFEKSKQLAEIHLKLDGEQLIISEKTEPIDKHAAPTTERPESEGAHSRPSPTSGTSTSSATTAASSFAFGNVGTKPPSLSQQPEKPEPVIGKPSSPSHETPEIPMPIHASTMVLRVMPDDNSCLFRAFNFAFLGGMDNMHELRSVIAQAIQANRDKYTAVVLDKEPDKYCRWIQTQDAWGGGIELGISSIKLSIIYTHSYPPFGRAWLPNPIERMLIPRTRYTERAFRYRDLHHRCADFEHCSLQ